MILSLLSLLYLLVQEEEKEKKTPSGHLLLKERKENAPSLHYGVSKKKGKMEILRKTVDQFPCKYNEVTSLVNN